MINIQYFSPVGSFLLGSGLLTRKRAAQDLQPHTKRAVPALRDDSNVARHHWLCKPVHDRGVFVAVSKKQLDKNGENSR